MQTLFRSLVPYILCLPLLLAAPIAAAVDLVLLSSVPSANAVDVPRRPTTATLFFSVPLNASTATSSSVSLVGPEGPETVTITVAGSQLRIRSTRSLGMLAHYTLRVTTGLRGAAGETLPRPVDIPFMTSDGNWLGTEFAGVSPNDTTEAQVVVDRAGNAQMVWIRQGNVFAQGRVNGIWGEVRALGNIAVASHLHLAGNPAGVAYAVWQEDQGFVHLAQFVPDLNWLRPTRIGADNGLMAGNPRVAVNETDDAIVVWEGTDAGTTSVFAALYRPFFGILTRSFRLDGSNRRGSDPRVAFSNGTAIAVWDQLNDLNVREIHWSGFDMVSWTAAQNTIASNTAGATHPEITLSPNGQATATWIQDERVTSFFTTTRAYGNHFSGGSWGSPFAIGPAGNNALDMRLASDDAGNAIAVWSNVGVGLREDIHANRYIVGRGWDMNHTPLEQADATTGPAVLAMDKSGNALAIWGQRTDGTHYWPYFSRYTAGGSWSAAERIFAPDTISASGFSLGVNGTGQAMVIWSQTPGQFFLDSRME